MGKFNDLTGKRFERLLVIKRAESYRGLSGKTVTMWLCKCDCGNEKIVSRSALISGNTKSCGCYNEAIHTLPDKEASINRIYSIYKYHAEKRKLPFELSKEEFLQLTRKNCYYCGKQPSNIQKNIHNQGDFTYNGIDRINPLFGYTINNVVSCCWECNKAKGKRNMEDFIKWINDVYNNINNK
jgi:hypothetical protein